MITIARIINAWRDAEQFELPTEDRSRTWHLLIWPQFGFAIFAIPIYQMLLGLDNDWIYILLGIDAGLSWLAFELSLDYFRSKY